MNLGPIGAALKNIGSLFQGPRGPVGLTGPPGVPGPSGIPTPSNFVSIRVAGYGLVFELKDIPLEVLDWVKAEIIAKKLAGE